MLGKKIGIDLGSTALRLYLKGEGIVSVEPSVVAVDAGDGAGPARAVAVGSGSYTVASRETTQLRHPVRPGAIGDPMALDAAVLALVSRACGRQRIFKPDVMVAVASMMPGEDRRRVLDACVHAGARSMYLIDAPLAAAIGAGHPVQSPVGRLIADIGGGTLDVAVIATEGAVSARCITHAGSRLTGDIAAHLSRLHDADVDMPAAEEVKREIASAVPLVEERTLRVSAVRSGAPVELIVSSSDVHRAMESWLQAVTSTIVDVLADTPRRLLTDIRTHTGLTLTGAGATLRGLDRHLAATTGLAVTLAPDTANACARGAGTALETLEVVRRTYLYVR